MSTQAQYETVFATRLRGLLEEKKVTITALAKELQISRQAVSQYADGASQPNADKLRLIAQYLGVSADYLLGLSDYRKAENEGITAKEMGIGEDVAIILHLWRKPLDEPPNDYVFPALNALMGSPQFFDWLHMITTYKKSIQEIASHCEDALGMDIGFLRQRARADKFLVTDMLNDMLDGLYPQPNWETVYQDALRKDLATPDRFLKKIEETLVKFGHTPDEIKAFFQEAEEKAEKQYVGPARGAHVAKEDSHGEHPGTTGQERKIDFLLHSRSPGPGNGRQAAEALDNDL